MPRRPPRSMRSDHRLPYTTLSRSPGQPRLPCVAEPGGVTGGGDAIFVVGVDMERRPGAVGDAHHAAALVGHQEPARAAADRAALVPDDRIVDAGAVDIAPLHRIAGVVLGDQVDAVILEPCGRAAADRKSTRLNSSH